MAEKVDNSQIGREHYYHFVDIPTRWMDNDVYGHVNNVTYYSYFDTTANLYLIHHCGLDPQRSEIVGFVVSSQCDYLSSLQFPMLLEGGLRVNRLGNSSVEYGIGVFAKGSQKASACGKFVHVFVDRTNNKSVPIPENYRYGLSKLLVSE